MARGPQTTQVLVPYRRRRLDSGGAGAAPGPGTAGLPALGPRRAGEILDAGVRALVTHFGVLMGVALAVMLPVELLLQGLWSAGPVNDLSDLVLQGLARTPPRMLALVFAAAVVGEALRGRRPRWGASLARSFGRPLGLLGLVLVSLGTQVLATTGMCCFVVPGLLVFWLFWTLPAAYALERAGPLQALSRSATLARGSASFGRWFGCALVLQLLLLPTVQLVGAFEEPGVRTGALELFGLSPLAYDLVTAGLGSLFLALEATASGAVVAAFYVDLRVRAEGLDLADALEGLEAREAGAGAGSSAPLPGPPAGRAA